MGDGLGGLGGPGDPFGPEGGFGLIPMLGPGGEMRLVSAGPGIPAGAVIGRLGIGGIMPGGVGGVGGGGPAFRAPGGGWYMPTGGAGRRGAAAGAAAGAGVWEEPGAAGLDEAELGEWGRGWGGGGERIL